MQCDRLVMVLPGSLHTCTHICRLLTTLLALTSLTFHHNLCGITTTLMRASRTFRDTSVQSTAALLSSTSVAVSGLADRNLDLRA